MSHAIEIDAVTLEAQGLPVIRNPRALTLACRQLGLLKADQELEWKTNARVSEGNRVDGYEVQFKGWQNKCYFNCAEGSVGFDNWPLYTADHVEVRNGNRRVGEEGRWGDFQHMLDLEAAYSEHAATMVQETIMEEAAMAGEMARVLVDSDEASEEYPCGYYEVEVIN